MLIIAMKTGKFVLFILAFVFFSGIAFAQDCDISSVDSEEFFFGLVVEEASTDTMVISLVLPYSAECAAEKNLKGLNLENIQCDGKVINDALFRSMGFFAISSECYMTYEEETEELLVETISVTDKLAKKQENGEWVIEFSKWDWVTEKEGAINTMEISLPQGSEIISYFPQQNSVEGNNAISWNPIPSEPISVKYSYKGTIESNIGSIILGFAALLVLAYFVYGKFSSQREFGNKMSEFDSEEEILNKKLQEAKIFYLKRKLSEDSYRKMVEEMTMKLSEIKTKRKQLLEKNKNNG